MKVTLYNQKGEKKGDVTLAKSIFEVKGVKPGLIHQYMVYQRANARMPIAHVKNRSAVNGGGAKPFRQKGTGRARQGSTTNVHMRGGGVAFGPKKWQNYSKQMPKAMRRKALFGILSKKAKDGMVMALDKFEGIKTKDFAELIKKLPIERSVLIVVNRDEKDLRMSSANLKMSKTVLSGYLNPADLLKYKNLLFTEAALKDITETYSK